MLTRAHGIRRLGGGLMFAALLAMAGCGGGPQVERPATVRHSPASARALLSNSTVSLPSRRDGRRILWLGSDGRALTLRPGANRPIHGRWVIRPETPRGPRICFTTAGPQRDPLTGRASGRWECLALDGFVQGLDEIYHGDVFRMRGFATLPPILPPSGQETIPQALQRLDLPAPGGRNLAPRRR